MERLVIAAVLIVVAIAIASLAASAWQPSISEAGNGQGCEE